MTFGSSAGHLHRGAEEILGAWRLNGKHEASCK